jgi:UDP-N-acetyl-D-mannosaminuronate dehydrogenase
LASTNILLTKKMKIAGVCGLPLAVGFGKHHPILGFDVSLSRIAELKVGLDPFQ